MARIIKRTWTSRGPTGHKVKRAAYGFTVQVDGKQERRFSAEWDREAAEKELEKFQKAHAAERAAIEKPPVLAFGAAVDRYLKAKERKRSVEHDRRLLAALTGHFGAETPLAEITTGRISEYRDLALARRSPRGEGKDPIAPATVNRYLAALRAVLRMAYREWELLPTLPRVTLEREPEGPVRYLDEPEAVRLLDACRESRNPHLHAIVTTALHTGMRRGEILGLTWERVDFSRAVLNLELTKNGKRREVRMNQAVDAALSKLPGQKAEGMVFRKADGAAWGQIRTAFEQACIRAKIEDFRFHDLRHTCASWLVMRGRPLKEIQELLGHRDFKMTLRYAHLSPGRLRDAVASLEDFSTKSAQSEVDSPPTPRKPLRARSSVG